MGMENETFKWTDELVAELLLKCVEFGKKHANDELPAFDNEKINKRIEELKSKTQSVSNKDYEIVSCMGINREIHKYEPRVCLGADKDVSKCTIHSVRRPSDGEVFSVLDKTTFGEIKSFEIHEPNQMRVWVYCNGGGEGNYDISALKKQKQFLFKTEDGVDIFESDDFWFINLDDYSYKKAYNAGYTSGKYSERKYFSTKEAGENYILMNKPCLSLNEVVEYSIHNGYGFENSTHYMRLRELIKSKL